MALGNENKKTTKKRTCKILIAVLMTALLAAAGGAGFYLYQQKGTKDQRFIEDALAEDGRLKKGTDIEKLQKALQKETDKNKFGYGINSKIEFLDGKSPGAFCIENPSTNRFDMQVKVVRDDTKETIYATDSIPPGYGIESARLNTELKKGQYACTAILWAMDKGEKAGEIRMPVLVIIQE